MAATNRCAFRRRAVFRCSACSRRKKGFGPCPPGRPQALTRCPGVNRRRTAGCRSGRKRTRNTSRRSWLRWIGSPLCNTGLFTHDREPPQISMSFGPGPGKLRPGACARNRVAQNRVEVVGTNGLPLRRTRAVPTTERNPACPNSRCRGTPGRVSPKRLLCLLSNRVRARGGRPPGNPGCELQRGGRRRACATACGGSWRRTAGRRCRRSRG